MKMGYLKDVNSAYVSNPGRMFKNMDDGKKAEVRSYLIDQFPQYEFTLRSDKLDISSVTKVMLVCKNLESICSWE